QAMAKKPHLEKVKLSAEERLRLAIWIDANAPYHDHFVNKRAPQPAYDLATDEALLREITAVHQRRCGGCHKPAEISRLDWIHLGRPEQSLFLSAALQKSAGGSARCPSPVYAGTDDPDYVALRAFVQAAVKKAMANPRRDLRDYVLENKMRDGRPRPVSEDSGQSRRSH
ncbi:MAG TPA: hypothetical protein VNZ22_17355, partial [Bacillota bacterium]|nr:hypothetical protein [Bacillota bacterium]